MAVQITSEIEQDGFVGRIYEDDEKGTKFVSWQLAEFWSETAPGGIPITGATGEGAGPRAAAWNLQHPEKKLTDTQRYLRNVLRGRVQIGSTDSGIRVRIPGAKVRVHGYEDPLELNLQAFVDGPNDIELAVRGLAGRLANTVARGVYALTRKDAEEAEEDTESLQF